MNFKIKIDIKAEPKEYDKRYLIIKLYKMLIF